MDIFRSRLIYSLECAWLANKNIKACNRIFKFIFVYRKCLLIYLRRVMFKYMCAMFTIRCLYKKNRWRCAKLTCAKLTCARLTFAKLRLPTCRAPSCHASSWHVPLILIFLSRLDIVFSFQIFLMYFWFRSRVANSELVFFSYYNQWKASQYCTDIIVSLKRDFYESNFRNWSSELL